MRLSGYMAEKGWEAWFNRTCLLLGSSLTLELRPRGGGGRYHRLDAPNPARGPSASSGRGATASLGRDGVVGRVPARGGSGSEGPFGEGECRDNREASNPRVSLSLRSH